MEKVYVYVDESGTLPDPKDKVIVIAAVGTLSPGQLGNVFKEIAKSKNQKRPGGEIKFYTAGEKTKRAFFDKVAKQQIEIFIMVVDKRGRKIPDSPGNYAILCWLLISEILNFYSGDVEIIFDRHFTSATQLREFNQALTSMLGKPIRIKHLNSQTNKIINFSDMIAGAVLAKETNKNSSYFTAIEGKIITALRVNWPEAKRRFFDKKRLAEPV